MLICFLKRKESFGLWVCVTVCVFSSVWGFYCVGDTWGMLYLRWAVCVCITCLRCVTLTPAVRDAFVLEELLFLWDPALTQFSSETKRFWWFLTQSSDPVRRVDICMFGRLRSLMLIITLIKKLLADIILSRF